MRELNGGGRSGNGGTLVAAAVAVLERQALSTSGSGGHTSPNVSIKVQTPQDNNTTVTTATTADSNRKSASPLMRSESYKKLHIKNAAENSQLDCPPQPLSSSDVKVSVIGARLKQNAKTFTSSITDVDVLCSDLMSNLEEALSEHQKEQHVNVSAAANDRDISKSTRSGFAYVDLRQNDKTTSNNNGVVLRRNGNAATEVNRNSSSTTTSAGTSDDFEDSSDETPTDTDDSDTTESETSSGGDEEGVHIVNEPLGLETITEEERPITASSVRTNEEYLEPGGDTSSPEDDSTLKGNATWSGTASNHESTSDLSTSESDRPKNQINNKPREEGSTCCNQDFQWIPKSSSNSPVKMEETPVQSHINPISKPPINRQLRDRLPRRHNSDKIAPGSLDRRRPHHHHNRNDRDQKSKSTHVPKSPSRDTDINHYTPCQNWCCNPHAVDPVTAFENFHRRHERMDPQRYGSSSMLMERERNERERSRERDQRHEFYHGSHPDLYSDYRYRPEPMGCCMYHTAPPYCRCGDSRNYRWTPPPPSKAPEHDDRIRRLQSENDNLQKEVFVLNERIDAQGERITELERSLQEKKQQLGNAEDLLQREMLSRSSLETQKLELMSAMSEMKLQQASLEREVLELRTTHSQCQYNNNISIGGVKKPPLKPRASPQPQHTSTPILHHQLLTGGTSPAQSPVVTSGLTSSLSQRRLDITSGQLDVQAPKTPPATYRRQVDLHYGSLPRQQFLSNGGAITLVDTNANPTMTNGVSGAAGTPGGTPGGTGSVGRKGVAFGKGFSSLLGVRARGHSVPNLAETEKIVIDDISLQPHSNVNDSSVSLSPQPSPSLQPNKNKGIKKIFGRMKRSGSGNLEDLPGEGEFRRGGVRATAGPRLGWNEHNNSITSTTITQRPDAPFAEWDTDAICDWLQDLGLESYMNEAKRWVKNGAQLQQASAHDLEKELSIKNVLHRKKLQLAITDEQGCSSDPFLSAAGRLDTTWVLRWLDDTGLPQHKDAFLANRVDGRVLHRLTIDDLASLHITSVLHVASLRRGVQVLREHNFEPGCLTRRSLPDDPTQFNPQQIALWTTHRVMEWLRAVDLAEYAPNLRGAGVHGGLMIHEPKFTSELLATLLSIPPSKTLLRRHLNTHFKELLGRDVIQEKREAETTLGYTPLTPAAKLKVTKKSQFSLKKKKDKGEQDYGDLVCPLNNTGSQSGESNGSSSTTTNTTTTTSNSTSTTTTTSRDSVGMTKIDTPKVEVVCHLVDDPALAQDDRISSPSPSPSPLRNLV